MNRYVTLLAVLLAFLAAAFSVAGIMSESLLLFLAVSVILVGVGSLTGT